MNRKKILTLLCIIMSISALANDSTTHVKAQGGTGYKINDIRTFESTDFTVFKEDGVEIPSIRAQGGTGYKIHYKASETDQNITEGVLDEINLINIFKGPVVGLSPLKVFNIDTLITHDTFLENINSLEDLELGSMVKVSGFVDSNSSAIVTRVELLEELNEWKISGYPKNITPYQFEINNQVINYTVSQVSVCDGPLVESMYLEVHADGQVNFDQNSDLQTVTGVKCISQTFENTDSSIILEGVIDLINNDSFILSGQHVQLQNRTRFIRGRVNDLQQWVKIEVEGELDSTGLVLDADKVRFIEPRFNLILPVSPENVETDTLNVAGVNIMIPPQFIDPEELFTNGLNQITQIKLKGYDQNGQLYLTHVNSIGNINYDEISGNGLITAIEQPFIQVFGMNVDATDGEFFNSEGHSLSSSEFFTMLQLGDEVEIESSTLIDGSGGLVAGRITIIEQQEDETESKTGFNNNVIGIGQLTSKADVLFKAAFE